MRASPTRHTPAAGGLTASADSTTASTCSGGKDQDALEPAVDPLSLRLDSPRDPSWWHRQGGGRPGRCERWRGHRRRGPAGTRRTAAGGPEVRDGGSGRAPTVADLRERALSPLPGFCATLRRMEPARAKPLSQLRRGVLEYCVLALLDTEQLYGFDLVRRLDGVHALVIGEGTVYPLLSRLRRQGWVTTSWVESTSGPPRRYYASTDEGRDALLAFTQQWREFRDAVDRLLPPEENA